MLTKGVHLRSARDFQRPICAQCRSRLSNALGKPNLRSSSTRATSRLLSQRAYFRTNKVVDQLGQDVYAAPSVEYFTSRPVRRLVESFATSTGSSSRPRPSAGRDSPPAPLNGGLAHKGRRRGTHSSGFEEPVIPPDASSRLSTLSTTLPAHSFRRTATAYLALSKPRLSFLTVLTAAAAYSLYPTPTLLLPDAAADIAASSSFSSSLTTLGSLTAGTALCCASANALNMLLEPQHDALMSRTRNRPLVRGLVGWKGALAFAVVTAGLGVAWLAEGVNPTVAGLGAANIALYAGAYTPLKRISVANTWVGAVVGGIPPLMGWAAAAGQVQQQQQQQQQQLEREHQQLAERDEEHELGDGRRIASNSVPAQAPGPSSLLLGRSNVGGWLLAGLLFAWQFPHFNGLSWTIRDEYRAAGHRMLAWVDPRMNARVALRYSLLLFPLCFGLSWCGVTSPSFVLTSSVANAWLVREAWRFCRHEGRRGTARGVFWASVWHLPVVMVLAMVQKRGLWERIYGTLFGGSMGDDEDDEELEEGEEEEEQEERKKGMNVL